MGDQPHTYTEPLPGFRSGQIPWRHALSEYLRAEALPVEKFGHQPRLYALTQEIGKALTYDDDVVFAAAYLHDLGVFTGHRPEDPEQLARWDHVTYVVDRAPALLRSWSFPESRIGAVLACIRTHQPKDDPKTLEATILRDADILEQLGTVGALRTICKVGRDTRFPTFTAAVQNLQRALDTLPGLLRLEPARALAESRTGALRAFLEAVENEADGRLF